MYPSGVQDEGEGEMGEMDGGQKGQEGQVGEVDLDWSAAIGLLNWA